jgi:hypothetical protein
MFWSLVGDETLVARIETAIRLLWGGIGKKSQANSVKKIGTVKRK